MVSYSTRFIWYLPCALLTVNRQHWRLTRPVSLLNLPVTPIILVTLAPVPVALDRPVALNRNQESLDPLNQMQGPLTLHQLRVNVQVTLNGL